MSANAEMNRYWNEASGPRWVEFQHWIDRQIEPLGARALERARLGPGERVLDVGCGCGATALAAARAVGPEGSVTGIDLSLPMLTRARERAAEASLANLEFLHADAQTATLAKGFDVVFSRFGVMFFEDPVRAFENLRRSLVARGRLVFVCWQALARNAWMRVPLEALASVLPLAPPASPTAPGPFAFADDARVRGILEQAGFGEIAFESVQEVLPVGPDDLEGSVRFALAIGPAGAALRDSPEAAARRHEIESALREALRPYWGPRGVTLASASWIVTARSGG